MSWTLRVEINAVLVATSDSRHIRNGSGMRNRRFFKTLDPIDTEICVLAHFAKKRAQEGICSFQRKNAKTQKKPLVGTQPQAQAARNDCYLISSRCVELVGSLTIVNRANFNKTKLTVGGVDIYSSKLHVVAIER
jgi:hypothetical protein